jgi:hypothetical protein
MMPRRHAAISLGVGFLGWWWTKVPAVLPWSLVAGVLVDLDHVVDYGWYTLRGEHRLILPLHGYEVAFALWWTAKRLLGPRAAIPIVASYVLHLLGDERENDTRPGSYSLIWRSLHGFRLSALSHDPPAGIRGRQEDLEKLRRLLSSPKRIC